LSRNSTSPVISDHVTVVIPTWNRSAMLERAIVSVTSQTQPVKLLVCDDGSTDDSAKTFERAMLGSSSRWVPGDHSGLPAVPRNRGIREATGDWIAFLDSDDEWLPSKITTQLKYAMQHGAICCNALRIVPPCDRPPQPYLPRRGPRITWRDLLKTNHVITSTAMVRADILRAAEGFPEQPSLKAVEDLALWLRVATYTDFAYVPECLARYTDSPGDSIRSTVQNSEDDVYERVLTDFVEWACRTSGKGEYAEAAREALRLGAWGSRLTAAGTLRRVFRAIGERLLKAAGSVAGKPRHID
jgi:teichuronic acid biosynthesis glycosyltransferase TuaG